MTTLKITHNAGILSCYSKRLEGIVWFFNTHKHAPDAVDSSEQFSRYKASAAGDITPLYVQPSPVAPGYMRPVTFYNDLQFVDYRGLDFAGLQPFIESYFAPSEHVRSILAGYERTYAFDYGRTCGVFYRGNDKSTETALAGYRAFVAQAKEIQRRRPDTVFLVQTDEAEFLEQFLVEFPDAIHIEEVPRINRQPSTVHDQLPQSSRAEFGARFLAATLALSKCRDLVTHSGNCGLWAVLYRGNCNGVSQWLGGSWKRSTLTRALIAIRVFCKKFVRELLKGKNGWNVARSVIV